MTRASRSDGSYSPITVETTDVTSRIRGIVLIGLVLACAFMGAAWLATPSPPPGANGPLSFAEVFQRPHNRAEVMINRRDGPAFAQLATDLSLDHPEGFHDHFAGSTPAEELSYRAGRPLTAWATWVLSAGGHRSLLAPALMLTTIVGLGAIVAATARLAAELGGAPKWTLAVLVLPGLGVALWAPGGCEPGATAPASAATVLLLNAEDDARGSAEHRDGQRLHEELVADVLARRPGRAADAEKLFNGEPRKYPKGTFIYRLAGREREKSASYYTPEVLTQCLVKYALKELLKDIQQADDMQHR